MLIELAFRADEHGAVHCRITELVGAFATVDSSIRLVLKHLEFLGAIERVSGQGARNGLEVRLCLDTDPEEITAKFGANPYHGLRATSPRTRRGEDNIAAHTASNDIAAQTARFTTPDALNGVAQNGLNAGAHMSANHTVTSSLSSNRDIDTPSSIEGESVARTHGKRPSLTPKAKSELMLSYRSRYADRGGEEALSADIDKCVSYWVGRWEAGDKVPSDLTSYANSWIVNNLNRPPEQRRNGSSGYGRPVANITPQDARPKVDMDQALARNSRAVNE